MASYFHLRIAFLSHHAARASLACPVRPSDALHANQQIGQAEALVPYDIRPSIAVVLSLSIHPSPPFCNHLRDELNDTTGLLDLPLGVLGEVARANDERDFGDAALAEHLGVAEREQVEHGGGVLGRGAGEVLFALLGGDEGPELCVSC